MAKKSNLLIAAVMLGVFAVVLGVVGMREWGIALASSEAFAGKLSSIPHATSGKAEELDLGVSATDASPRGSRRLETFNSVGPGDTGGGDSVSPGPDGTVCPVPGPTPEPCGWNCRRHGWKTGYVTTYDSFGVSHSRRIKYYGCIRWVNTC